MRLQVIKKFLLLLLLAVFTVTILCVFNGQQEAHKVHLKEIQHQQQNVPGHSNGHSKDSIKTLNKFIVANHSSIESVCHTPQCIARYEAVSNRPNRIPPIRHILWKTENVSSYMAKQLKTWSDIHPEWKYVLWRDADLDKFISKHYTGMLSKFRSLPHYIMRIDMIRYAILHHFGGVYADLDYVLVQSLDRFLKFPAVVTRETEAHSLFHYGMGKWPPPILGNPAFMMSEPGHPFYHFCMLQLKAKQPSDIYNFAGPQGLTTLLTQYMTDFKVADNPDGVVVVPASRSFYPFKNNSLASSTSTYKDAMIGHMQNQCKGIQKSPSVAKNLADFCKDVNILDPITDPNEPVYAIHDSNKRRSSYDNSGSPEFHDNPVDIRSVLPNVVMADTMY